MSGPWSVPDVGSEQPPRSPRWRRNLVVLGVMLAYMAPLMWLWTMDSYPEGFGVHLAGSGRAIFVGKYWYSYLLAERHHPLDLIIFAYMWIGLGAIAVASVRGLLKDRTA